MLFKIILGLAVSTQNQVDLYLKSQLYFFISWVYDQIITQYTPIYLKHILVYRSVVGLRSRNKKTEHAMYKFYSIDIKATVAKVFVGSETCKNA